MNTDNQEASGIIQCPKCGGPLDWAGGCCRQCQAAFRKQGAVVDFLDDAALSAQNLGEIELHKRITKGYHSRYAQTFSKVYSDYWNEQFLRHIPENCRTLLECGCGTGDLLRCLLDRTRIAVGLDISPDMIGEAVIQTQNKPNVSWIVSPGERLPFKDAVFDVVCFRGALHHMADEAQALREAHRVLRPGGRLLLSEPNGDSLALAFPRYLASILSARFRNDHKAFRTRPWLQTISGIGFVVLETKFFSFLSQPLCGMSDLLPLMKFVRQPERLAKALVALDERLARTPVLRRQSFDFFVAAEKKQGA